MSSPPETRSAVADAELVDALERSLGQPVATLERQPSRYATSATLEWVDAVLADGAVLALALKDMSPGALLDGARRAKPSFLYNPSREIDTYRLVLDGAGLGTARCYGAAADDAARRYWLLLERIPGVELYQVGELDRWEHAARWLARAHAALTARAGEVLATGSPALILHDRTACRRWMERAVAFCPDRRIDRVAAVHDAVVDRYAALPATVVHGELFASNVLLCGDRADERVCAVDWEMAGVGPGLHDLAALVSGEWREEDRTALVRAYHEAAIPDGGLTLGDTQAALDVCRLQLCVQLIGWSPDWAPPGEHAHDWLGEAVELAERVAS